MFDLSSTLILYMFVGLEEREGKEKEDKKKTPLEAATEQDEISLFFSDIMPLLVSYKFNITQCSIICLPLAEIIDYFGLI